MRGISEQISITFGDSVYVFEQGMDNRGIDNTGVHAIADLSELKNNKKLPYEVQIKLKGSQSINFIPVSYTHLSVRAIDFAVARWYIKN